MWLFTYQRVVSCWRHPDTIAAELTWPLRATCLRWRSVYVLVEHIPSGVLAITRPRAGRHNPVIWNELSPPHFSIFFHLFLILRRCSDVVTWVLSKISDPNSSGLVDVPRQVRPDTKRFGAWLMPCTRPWCLPPGRKRGDFWHFGPNKHGDLFFLPPKDRGEFGPTTVLMGFVFFVGYLDGDWTSKTLANILYNWCEVWSQRFLSLFCPNFGASTTGEMDSDTPCIAWPQRGLYSGLRPHPGSWFQSLDSCASWPFNEKKWGDVHEGTWAQIIASYCIILNGEGLKHNSGEITPVSWTKKIRTSETMWGFP